MKSRFLPGAVAVLLCLCNPRPCFPYSFLTHEQLVDLTWTDTIKPLLKRRFPTLSDADLLRAHSYAYGGSAIQDLGYYPFGNEFFSDLTHYVRSGDFVLSLFRHAQSANELAFAIGAMSHYLGDAIGHSEAVNPAVAAEFPNLAKKFGSSVNYAEDPHAHVRVEFAFDINEASKHHLAPSAYLRHVGLRISYSVLSDAFRETYGLEMRPILGRRRPVVRGYRFAVRSFLPRITYAEVVLHRNGFPREPVTPASRAFQAQLDGTEFAIGWNAFRKKPGLATYAVAGAIFIVPKIGRLSELSIRGPQAATTERYIESVERSTELLRQNLQQHGDELILPNRDLDTGDRVRPGGYPLTDETYAQLLRKITHSTHGDLPATLKQDILTYYADPAAPIATKKNNKKWRRVQADLQILQAMQTRPDIH
jgi:hypothetical protein